MRIRGVLGGIGGAVCAGAVAAALLIWRPEIATIDPPATENFARASIERGAQLGAIGDCAICHTATAGRPYAGGRALATPFGIIYATNITPDPQTGIGAWSRAAFARAMRDGVDRAGRFLYPAFPYDHFTHVTDPDIDALYAFLMTRDPVRAEARANRLPFPLDIRAVVAGWDLLFLRHGPVTQDASKDAAWNRGAYLVEGLGHCGACHTPHNALGAERHGSTFAGGAAEGWDGPGLTAATSPAPSPWTEDTLFRFLRNGIDARHTAAAGPMGPVSHDLSSVPEADVRAMAVYLASLTAPADAARERGLDERVARAQSALPEHSPGSVIFAGACAGCHGQGAPMMLNGRPSLALGSSVAADTPRNAIQIVLHGLQPATGERGPWMPGFADSLTDSQVGEVLDYLRARFTDRPAWTDTADRIQHIRKENGS